MRIENNMLIRVKPDEIIKGQIVIPKNITAIDKFAFWDCADLITINLPEGITSIDEYAFAYCKSLININLPESITSISKYAFANCENLININLPKSITSIEECAFSKCHNLISITLSKGITSIGMQSFGDCGSLISITLPESITSIGPCAFWNCFSLTSITLSEDITSIGEFAFAGCSSLNNINIIASTPAEFERIKALLPDLHQKCVDVISNLRREMDALEQHISLTRDNEGELGEVEIMRIMQLSSQIDTFIGHSAHQDMLQKMNNILTMRMMLLLDNNQIHEAIAYFIDTPKPSTEMAFALASALLASNDNTKEAYQSILHLFKEYDDDTDVRTLLERSVLNTLSLLTKEQPAALSDKLADYTINRCLPCSAILNTIKDIPGLDEELRKQFNEAESLLPMLTATEIHQLINTATLKDAFIEKYRTANIVTYESIALLSSKEEADSLNVRDAPIELTFQELIQKMVQVNPENQLSIATPGGCISNPSSFLDNKGNIIESKCISIFLKLKNEITALQKCKTDSTASDTLNSIVRK